MAYAGMFTVLLGVQPAFAEPFMYVPLGGEGETVAVEFVPQKPGEYEFACAMGMFRGKLIVE